MPAELLSVLVLVAVFALAMWRPVNMGAVALVAAFVLGTAYFGLDPDDVAKGFPGSLLVTLVGVTWLFAIAKHNGTVDRIVGRSVQAVGGRVVLVPWVLFLLAAAITGSGAVSAATNAILAPVGLAFAQRYRIHPMLVGLSILNGTNAGGFSPISVYFSIVDGVLVHNGVQVNAGGVFLATFLFNLALNLVAFTLFGGWKLLGRGKVQPAEVEPADGPGAAVQRWSGAQVLTIALLVLLVIGALGFDLDVGFGALAAAVALTVIFPRQSKDAAAQIGWSVVLLIGGIVTYVTMLQNVGVVDSLGASIAGISQPLLAALLILLVGGLVSAFASTNAMFGALVPLAVPFMASGDIAVFGFVTALCVAASAVDSSPFSTGGALVVANTEESERTRTFRNLMAWGMSMIGVAPLAAWLVFLAVPGLV
ncbi:SLC13 family permease [Saccharopolyspora sp. 5N708]|uniref:SLC13 family permease n=1 Tax=Saccharopolyspora sp. 5N708 TaxID=3457424 RepID=UPI003FD6794B